MRLKRKKFKIFGKAFSTFANQRQCALVQIYRYCMLCMLSRALKAILFEEDILRKKCKLLLTLFEIKLTTVVACIRYEFIINFISVYYVMYITDYASDNIAKFSPHINLNASECILSVLIC